MSRKVRRVRFRLDPGDVKELPLEDVKAILRGADDLIMSGGRALLARVLKGSRAKKVLELGLDRSPVYGHFSDLTLREITARIDWVIVSGYLRLEYDYRLPLLVYTEAGWEIEKDTYSDELLEEFRKALKSGDFEIARQQRDRNRGLILLLLSKIAATGDAGFIPLLEEWARHDYRKVREAIREVIASISQ